MKRRKPSQVTSIRLADEDRRVADALKERGGFRDRSSAIKAAMWFAYYSKFGRGRAA